MTRPRREALAWTAAAAAGLLVDLVALGDDALLLAADVVTGWVFLGCALAVRTRRPGSRVGLLLGLVGATWFLGALLPALTYLHRGVLVHALLTYPSGRVDGIARWVIPLMYVASVVPAVWGGELSSIVVASLLVAAFARHRSVARGALRRARSQTVLVGTVLMGTVAATAFARLLLTQGDADVPALLTYQAALVVVAILLTRGLALAQWERAPVTDLVVQLGDPRSGAVRDALARALGDPSLQVGYRRGDEFVDAAGQRVVTPEPASGRAATPVAHHGETVAVLVHDESLLSDPGLADALSVASRLVGENARLHDEVGARVREIEESRARLVLAADRQREALERELSDGALTRLMRLGERLTSARDASTGTTVARVEDALGELARTRQDLAELAGGLHPRILEQQGLVAALHALADGFPVPVAVTTEPDAPTVSQVPPAVAAAAWFACAEAVTNVVKHAAARGVELRLTVSAGRLEVTVADDGRGGADAARGTGLQGLADRVEAAGGRLEVTSTPDAGTRVVAILPTGSPVTHGSADAS